MGRHSSFLHKGKGMPVGLINKFVKEDKKNQENNQALPYADDTGLESEILYTPLEPPADVISQYGFLRIKPSIIYKYINELRVGRKHRGDIFRR